MNRAVRRARCEGRDSAATGTEAASAAGLGPVGAQPWSSARTAAATRPPSARPADLAVAIFMTCPI